MASSKPPLYCSFANPYNFVKSLYVSFTKPLFMIFIRLVAHGDQVTINTVHNDMKLMFPNPPTPQGVGAQSTTKNN